MIWYESKNRHRGVRHSIDAPCLTVMAAGMGDDSYGHWRLVSDSRGKEMARSVVDKSPYVIPTMAEVRAVPWNGFNVASTFSGCGGSCLGYRMAGFRVLWASEFIPAAQETYRANHPETTLDCRDIRQVAPEEVLKAMGLAKGELDLLDGSPPCASFSTAGKRQAHWGQVKKYSDSRQRTDDLFFEYARLLEGLQPKVFVAENVSGLVKGTAKGYFKMILARLRECGYEVEAKVLDAQWLGVPQMRSRLIFVGVRKDLGVRPAHPKPFPYQYTLRDALPGLQSLTIGDPGHRKPPGSHFNRGREVSTNAPSPTIMAAQGIDGTSTHNIVRVIHDTRGASSYHFQVHEEDLSIDRFAIGREWDKLKPGEQSDRYFSLMKAGPDRPCNAVTAAGRTVSAAAVVHPFEKRRFTIDEVKRICSFPADFILTGTYGQQWERLGRAVPPLMMRAIASTVRDEILRKI